MTLPSASNASGAAQANMPQSWAGPGRMYGTRIAPVRTAASAPGIAPLRRMVDAGVKVGLGVDGSASNDTANLLGAARQALLLQRVTQGAGACAAREALRLATRGGAEVRGRCDLGQLRPGLRADSAVWGMADVAFTGAWDLVAGLVLAPPAGVRDLFVEGRAVVRGGDLVRTPRAAVLKASRTSLNRPMALI